MPEIVQIWFQDEAPPHCERWATEWKHLAAIAGWGYVRLGMAEFRELVIGDRIAWLNNAAPPLTRRWYRMASDMLRYEWLYKHGGFYLDMDTQPTHESYRMLTGEVGDHPLLFCAHPGRSQIAYVCNGIMWFPKPEHPLMGQMRRCRLPRDWHEVEQRTAGLLTGPQVLTRLYRQFREIRRKVFPYACRTDVPAGKEHNNVVRARILLHQDWAGPNTRKTWEEQRG